MEPSKIKKRSHRKRNNLTISEVVRRVSMHKPRTIEAARDLFRVNMKELGRGSSRQVYQVGDLPLVLKFPSRSDKWNKTQSAREYAAYRRVMQFKKYKALRPLMPRIFLYDKTTGVIAMRKYDPVPRGSEWESCRKVQAVFRKTTSAGGADIHESNLGMTKAKSLKVIDLGYETIKSNSKVRNDKSKKA